MPKITAPVAGFTGKVAGVSFSDGKGETDDDRAIAYFRRKGYGIGNAKPTGGKQTIEPTDPRKVGDGTGVEVVGTRLRDAAVDPDPNDFLPPTNAGEANPHGPEVVSPEIHASQGVRPVKPGDVHVDDPDAQEAAETEHAEAATDGEPITDGTPEQPAKSASKGEWVDYAIASGMPRADAEAATKKDLVDRYGQED